MKYIEYCLLTCLLTLSGISEAQKLPSLPDIQKTFSRGEAGTSVPGHAVAKDLWPRIYTFNNHAGGTEVYETYDSGYMILGDLVDNDMVNRMSFIIKTDVNGNPLWRRFIGDQTNQGAFSHITPTQDGGCVLIGSTTTVDQCADNDCYDAWIMKLDACGNKEWCKIYSVPMDVDVGSDIVQLSNGNYVALVNCFGYDIAEERIWLFCLSPDGKTIWQKVYLTSEHPQWATNGYGYELLKDDDENLLLTGECVLYDNYINPNSWSFQMLHIKFTGEGEEIWGKPWYMNYDSTHYGGRVSAQDFNGNYTSGGGQYSGWSGCNCHPPVLFRQTKEGVNIAEIRYTQGLPPYIGSGGITGLTYLEPNKLALATTYRDEPGFVPGHNVIRISDTLGNILNETEEYYDWNEIFGIIKTTDNHILTTSAYWITPDSLKLFLCKYTLDLEYPATDTRPLVYDYLCAETPQANDTIFPDCDIIVGMAEPMHQVERYSLLASPNPASEQLTLTIPDRMMKEWESNGLSSRTLYYTLPDNLQLQFTDALGRMCETVPVGKGTQQVTVDVSRWPAGIYLAKLTGGNSVVAEVKVVVR